MRFTHIRALLCALLTLVSLTASRALDEEPPPTPDSGTRVEWRGWTFRWAVRHRDGLVLTDVSFQGRPVLKYAGLAEIFVPYDPGQPRPEDSLDGMGATLFELVPGKDCIPGTVCWMYDAQGKLSSKPVVAMHEESTGLIYQGELGRAYGKMLILWCSAKLGGYTYLIRWRFRDDGFLMPQVGLTGRLEHTRPGRASAQGSVVQRNANGETLFAPSHVHNFYYRLDFDIDGPEHDAVEEFRHTQDVPGRSLSGRDRWTAIARESARSLNSAEFRSWRVVDRRSKNALGHPRSYELMPGGNGVFRGAEDEEFAQADLWVTRHKPHEFPFSAADRRTIKRALPTYLNDEPVEDQNVVVWYALHIHHLPRSEDWPAMPVEWAGFTLAPRDFLDASPLRPQ